MGRAHMGGLGSSHCIILETFAFKNVVTSHNTLPCMNKTRLMVF